MASEHYDAVILGSGQGGTPLASALAGAGHKVALVEARHVGGSCINHGCTPSKTMIASARAAEIARRGPDYGISAPEVSARMPDVIARKEGVVGMFREGTAQGLDASGVHVIPGHARFSGPRRVSVELSTGGARELEAERLIINTGARPSVPPIEGLSSVPWLDSTAMFELRELPQHLIVIGGGYVGLEFAQMFRRFGSEVTIVQRGWQLLASEDEDIARSLEEILRGDGIDVRVESQVERARRGERGGIHVDVRGRRGEPESLSGSHLLVATGRRPNTDDLGLERAGVETDENGYVAVTDRLETSARGVYALGDAVPGPAFTHISYDDSRVLRKNLLERGDSSVSGRLVPYCVFTDPQLGRVGLSEAGARARGVSYDVFEMQAGRIARAIELGETRGVWKVLVSPETDKILGAAILGVEGGEVMGMLQIAMMGDVPQARLRDAAFAHPTLAEALNNLFASSNRS